MIAERIVARRGQATASESQRMALFLRSTDQLMNCKFSTVSYRLRVYSDTGCDLTSSPSPSVNAHKPTGYCEPRSTGYIHQGMLGEW